MLELMYLTTDERILTTDKHRWTRIFTPPLFPIFEMGEVGGGLVFRMFLIFNRPFRGHVFVIMLSESHSPGCVT